MKTYKVEFNDFGVVYILASSFKEAEEKFLSSGDGGQTPSLKSITFIGKGII